MSGSNSTPPDDLSFEKAIERLESLVDHLESEDTGLEAALEAYEEGMHLTRHCQDKLDAAQLRVQELSLEKGD